MSQDHRFAKIKTDQIAVTTYDDDVQFPPRIHHPGPQSAIHMLWVMLLEFSTLPGVRT
jgi:hypothetical protein